MGRSSYRGKNYIENNLKGNVNNFKLVGGSRYRGFELLRFDCTKVPKSLNPLSPSIHIQILQTDLHTFP